MNVQAVRAYTDPIVRDASTQNVIRKQDQRKAESLNNQTPQSKSTANQLLTRKEREFFIKMFPENSNQIENHVLFNRNGRLQTQSFSKGLIVDSRV
jgi:hypothetical protein